MHVDYSENYSCKYSKEIKETHFGKGNEQVTLHTGVTYLSRGRVEAFASLSACLPTTWCGGNMGPSWSRAQKHQGEISGCKTHPLHFRWPNITVQKPYLFLFSLHCALHPWFPMGDLELHWGLTWQRCTGWSRWGPKKPCRPNSFLWDQHTWCGCTVWAAGEKFFRDPVQGVRGENQGKLWIGAPTPESCSRDNENTPSESA